MGIMLTPAEYGTLFSLTSILAIVMIFSQGIQTAIAKYTSAFKAEGAEDRIKYLWSLSLKWGILTGCALFLLFAIFSPQLSNFLNIDTNWYLIALLSASIFVFALPVNRGIIQGYQRFLFLGSTNALLHLLTLVLAVIMVYVGLGVGGGLVPFVVAYAILFIVTLAALRPLRWINSNKTEICGLFSYTGLTLLAVLFFAVATNVDIILIKHYFSPEAAGTYSAISVLGKICLYAPMGIAIAMLPKSAALYETGAITNRILIKAIAYTSILAGVIIILYFIFPESIINFIFGDKYPEAEPHLYKYGLAMAFFAMAFLLMNYLLSINCIRVWLAFFATMILQIVLIVFFHSGISQVMLVMLISGMCAIFFVLPYFRKVPKSKSSTAN
jgi:O-antigen/teichoic acid export membrane protein